MQHEQRLNPLFHSCAPIAFQPTSTCISWWSRRSRTKTLASKSSSITRERLRDCHQRYSIFSKKNKTFGVPKIFTKMSHLRFELRLPRPQRGVLTTIRMRHMHIAQFESLYLKLTVQPASLVTMFQNVCLYLQGVISHSYLLPFPLVSTSFPLCS